MDRTGGRRVYNTVMLSRYLLIAALVAPAASSVLMAQTPVGPARPPIVGVAHIRLKTADLAAARIFYGRQLGFQEPFGIDSLAVFKVNDHQYIEVEPTLKREAEDRLAHIAFETSDARRLRDYLASRGVKVPGTVEPDGDGNLSFFIKDADGHLVEFVEYLPGSLHSRNFGKALPPTRVSERMIHVGFTIQDRAAADKLYRDILGFRLQWYGGMTDERTDWVSMRVPDGTDWLEYMLNQPHPSPRTLGVMNHLALGVASAEQGYKTVVERGMNPTEKPKIGRDGKWQLNLYDPNYTRAELMEPKPVQPPCCSPILNP